MSMHIIQFSFMGHTEHTQSERAQVVRIFQNWNERANTAWEMVEHGLTNLRMTNEHLASEVSEHLRTELGYYDKAY